MTTFTELDANVQSLLTMLTFKRGHNSKGEKAFCKQYMKGMNTLKGNMRASSLKSIGAKSGKSKGQDILAYYKVIGDSPVMWSSHVDTVHTTDGLVNVVYDPTLMIASTDSKSQLGADDGAGVWIMLQMIEAGVPGTYVFHRGEECGGLGSSAMAEQHKDWLAQFKYAIAFDRRGNTSVITHQAHGRCCSDNFATALGTALNTANKFLTMANDSTGIFTDTANYVDIIPECTNISVGYSKEHTYKETLDVSFLIELRDGLIDAFLAGFDLPVERDPSVFESDLYDWPDTYFGKPKKGNSSFTKYSDCRFEDDVYDFLADMSYRELVDFVENTPAREVAEAIDIILSMQSSRVY